MAVKQVPFVSKTVVSRLRPIWLWAGSALTIAVAAAVFLRDLRGDGLNTTLIFKLFGVLTYPIFYGCVIALLTMLVRAFPVRNEWLTISGREMMVGRKKFAADEISQIQVRSNWLGLQAIILCDRNGSELAATKAWPLDRPIQEVVPRLRTWLAEQQSTQSPL
jgi:hypothetical protein